MAREFKPVRFFVMMAMAAFVVCGITSFYTHRAARGRTAAERAGYAIGFKEGKQASPGATLPTAADLKLMPQNYFKQQRSGNPHPWYQGLENDYTDGFNKKPARQ